MKLSHLAYALLTVTVLFMTKSAHADPEVARARFESVVGLDLLQATACGLMPTSTIDGRPRQVDVRVVDHRCATAAPLPGAIALTVRFEPGEVRYVVLEADVPDGVSLEGVRSSVVDIANELRTRLARAMQPPPITVVQASQWPTAAAQKSFHPDRTYGRSAT